MKENSIILSKLIWLFPLIALLAVLFSGCGKNNEDSSGSDFAQEVGETYRTARDTFLQSHKASDLPEEEVPIWLSQALSCRQEYPEKMAELDKRLAATTKSTLLPEKWVGQITSNLTAMGVDWRQDVGFRTHHAILLETLTYDPLELGGGTNDSFILSQRLLDELTLGPRENPFSDPNVPPVPSAEAIREVLSWWQTYTSKHSSSPRASLMLTAAIVQGCGQTEQGYYQAIYEESLKQMESVASGETELSLLANLMFPMQAQAKPLIQTEKALAKATDPQIACVFDFLEFSKNRPTVDPFLDNRGLSLRPNIGSLNLLLFAEGPGQGKIKVRDKSLPDFFLSELASQSPFDPDHGLGGILWRLPFYKPETVEQLQSLEATGRGPVSVLEENQALIDDIITHLSDLKRISGQSLEKYYAADFPQILRSHQERHLEYMEQFRQQMLEMQAEPWPR